MVKKFNMFALIVLLVFQTMIAPIAATAQTIEQEDVNTETLEDLDSTEEADVSDENEGSENEDTDANEEELAGENSSEGEDSTNEDASKENSEAGEDSEEPVTDDADEEEEIDVNEEESVTEESQEDVEVTSDNEVEKDTPKKQAIEPYAEITHNIFEFEYFRINEVDVEEGSEIGFDDTYQLQYQWHTEGLGVVPGDTARLTLPDVFKELPAGAIPPQPVLADGADGNKVEVGKYTIENGELIFTFDENILDGSVQNGVVGFNVNFDKEKFLEEWEQDIDFDGNGTKDLTVVAKPAEVETKLVKEGQPDQYQNAREITWSIDFINGSEEAITNGVLSDKLPDGVEDPTGFVVKEFSYDFEGNKVDHGEVDFNEPRVAADGFEMTFDNVPARGGYTVEYTTTITDYEISEFTNDATFVSDSVNLEAKTTVTTGERSNPIQKSGTYNGGTGQIDWTIIVNENGMEIGSAIVDDNLPAGLKIVEDSIKVTNNWQDTDIEATGFPITLGPVSSNDVYRINFSTDIDWTEVNGGQYTRDNAFTNKTNLTDGEDPIGENEHKVDVQRNTLIEKHGNANDYKYDDDKKVLSWIIDVNKAKHPIENAVITDILPAGLGTITPEDIKIGDTPGSAENITITPNGDGTQKVVINLGNIDSEVNISYKTKVEKFDIERFENEATLDGKGIGDGDTVVKTIVYPPGNSFGKTFKDIDYNEKTISWNIAVDPKREEIAELEIKDTFPNNGMILLPDSVVVKVGDTKLKEDDYTLVPNEVDGNEGYNKGFTIKLTSDNLPLNNRLTVDFKTSYDPQLEVDGNTIDDHIGDSTVYKNHADFTGKTVNGNDIEEDDDAETKVRDDSWNSGKKEGQLVHVDEEGNLADGWESGAERKIAWQLYTNYQKQNLGTGVVITDTLDYEGTIDKDSIVVSIYGVDKEGNTTITEESIDNYTVDVESKEFTLRFAEDFVVDERYVVEFTTSVPDISEENYKNDATIKVGDKEYPYSGTVDYDKWNDNLDKQALDQEGNEVFIGEELEWKVTVNESLSIIKNATIKDTISAGLAYLEDSLKITTGSETELVEGDDYTLTVTPTDDGETVLDIDFTNDVTEALTLNYTTVVVAENGQQVNNKVDLSGDGVENKSKETSDLTAKQFSWVGGNYSPNRGVIAIEKVDSEGNVIETGEATFELYFEMNGERVLVGEYSTQGGTLEIPNLPLRTYYLTEVAAPEGYVLTDQEIEVVVDKAYGSNQIVFDVPVTNYREDEEPEPVEVSVEKVWEDADNQDGIRSESITVNLLANGEVETSEDLNEENNWSHVFTDLSAVDEDENDIEYTVEEVAVEGYETTISGTSADGFVITNSYTPEQININGTKTWEDADNQDGVRPELITVRLLANGEEIDHVEVTEEDEWNFSFTDLPKFENGEEITYTVQEDEVKDYSTVIDGFNITNGYTPGQTSINVVKSWEDANNQDGIRSDSIIVKLLADGEETDREVELNEGNNWQADFTELDVYAAGEEITYTIEEVAVEGYETTISGTSADGFVITNTYEPELIDLDGTKTWDDADNQDGARPDSITVNLLANGNEIDSIDVTGATDWTFEFTDLPKFENGEEINYTVQEDAVEDYSTVIDGFSITNSYTPGQTSINVMKAWEDANNQDGIRSDSITVKLLADGEETGQERELSEDNNWQADFTELDVNKDGKTIVYTVEEVAVDEYRTEITGDSETGFVITNTLKTYAIGDYTWIDSNKDGIQDEDEEVLEGVIVELYDESGENKLAETTTDENGLYIFDELPAGKYTVKFTLTDEQKEKYVFTKQNADENSTKDSDADPETGWTTVIELDDANEHLTKDYKDQGFKATEGIDPTWDAGVIEKTPITPIEPAKTKVSVEKVWIGEAQDEVTINLLADGEKVDSVELSEENDWKHTFTDLSTVHEITDEKAIEYTVEEVKVDGYNTEVTGDAKDGFTITNTEKTYAIGDYTWIDSNKDGIQDEDEEVLPGVKVELFDEDGEKVAETKTDKNGLYIFDELPAGKYKVKFTLTEEQAKKYEFTKQNAGDDSTVDSDADENGWAIEFTLDDTNEHLTKDYKDQSFKATEGIDPTWDAGVIEKTPITPIEPAQTKVSVEKVWIGEAQDKVTINLLADGEKVDSVELSEENDWKHTFTDLPTVHEVTDEKAIAYTVEEVEINGYLSEITGDIKEGFTITNTQEVIEITGTKTWKDDDAVDRPVSITVQVMNADEVVQEQEVTAEDDWNFTFTDLAKYDTEDNQIEYTINELPVPGYATEIDGFDITNTRADVLDIAGTKTWKDDNVEDRPVSITVQLLANGEVVDSIKVTGETDWTYVFENQDGYDAAGVAILYTVAEVEVDGYETSINGFDITNTLVPVEEDPEDPTDPEEPGKPVSGDKDPEDPKVEESDGDKLPKTATAIYNLAFIGFGLMLLGLILFLVRRKRVE